MKTELINLQHSSHTMALSKGTIFAKKTMILQKNADNNKINRVLILRGIFFKTKYVCTYMPNLKFLE